MKLTEEQIRNAAKNHGFDYASLRAVIEVESNGSGFLSGKIVIQFEPYWFQKYTGKRIANGVENQAKEWQAFNAAFKINQDAAMKSTSIGMMQVMGFHYSLLGFKTVGAMWDFAKLSEANQLELGIRFIKTNLKLVKALRARDWKTFAYYYNGENYKQFKYDTRLETAYNKFK